MKHPGLRLAFLVARELGSELGEFVERTLL
jgi:hypothetical protein